MLKNTEGYKNIMENNQLTFKLDIGQLIFKIFEEFVDNDLLPPDKQNLFTSQETISKIAVLTLYQIACLNKEYDKIKFNISDLEKLNEPEIVLIDNFKENEAIQWERKKK